MKPHSPSAGDNIHRLASLRKRVIVALLGAVSLMACGGWIWINWLSPSAQAVHSLEEADAARRSGRLETAERLAHIALTLDPDLTDAALLAAQCAFDQQRFGPAVEYLERVHSHQPQTVLRVSLLRGECLFRLHRASRAEAAYRHALEIDPDNIQANTELARLLAICARRSEAVPHILRLIRQEQQTDLLVLLAREDGVLDDRAWLEQARIVDPNDPAPQIGLAWHAAFAGRQDEAIALLEQSSVQHPHHAPTFSALGRHLLDAGRYEDLIRWDRRLPESSLQFAEIWTIRAALAEHVGDARGAIRCYWEAVRRSPELRTPNARLAQLLVAEGRPEHAATFAARLRDVLWLDSMKDRVLTTPQHDSVEPVLELVDAFERVGRVWEAYAWCGLAVSVDSQSQAARARLQRLRGLVPSLPMVQTVDRANPALRIDLSTYPPSDFGPRRAPDAPGSKSLNTGAISFRDDSAAAGLRFVYHNGTTGQPTRRMFEFTGGGIGVLDFDSDAWPDLCFTQGKPWPPDSTDVGYRDAVYRNQAGRRFIDVSTSAGIVDHGFGQGIAVGDFDADGFSDMFIANIGRDVLWRNNGDGTFADITSKAGIDGYQWTTSCVMADLDGNALPDIYAANYLKGDDVFDRVCRHSDGTPISCLPVHFDGEMDQLWRNLGDGRFAEHAADLLSVVPDGKGLGVAAWDADGSGRLSLLVANDTTPNFLFVPTAGSDGHVRLIEQAMTAGVAVDAQGKALGSMGIALGDVNDDGRLDVHITNFLNEASTLYLTAGSVQFEDRTRAYGLFEPTLDYLGFGTQFLDADLDGTLELFVANGHVDDLRLFDRPYAMRPQFFALAGKQFFEIEAGELGDYFQRELLGRAAARVDWNRDGRDDLVVGHLYEPAALLTNTAIDRGAYLSLRLVGVKSDREPIGATVTVRFHGRAVTRQLAAGESYQSSSERRLIIGLGVTSKVDELQIRWPSGIRQQFTAPQLSRELLLVEGRQILYLPNP